MVIHLDSGKQLRMIMSEQNINTSDLAMITGLSNATISNLSTGKVKKPNIETARQIAKVMGKKIPEIWCKLMTDLPHPNLLIPIPNPLL